MKGTSQSRLFYIQTVSAKKKGKPAQEGYKTVVQDHPSMKTKYGWHYHSEKWNLQEHGMALLMYCDVWSALPKVNKRRKRFPFAQSSWTTATRPAAGSAAASTRSRTCTGMQLIFPTVDYLFWCICICINYSYDFFIGSEQTKYYIDLILMKTKNPAN